MGLLQQFRDAPTAVHGAMADAAKWGVVAASLPLVQHVAPDGPGFVALAALGGVMTIRHILQSGPAAPADIPALLPSFCTEEITDNPALSKMTGDLCDKMGIKAPVRLFYGATDVAAAFHGHDIGYGIVLNKHAAQVLSKDELRFAMAHELGHIGWGDVHLRTSQTLPDHFAHAAATLGFIGGIIMGEPQTALSGLMVFEAWHAANQAQLRVRERRNDLGAAAVIEDADGGIDLFGRTESIYREIKRLEGKAEAKPFAPNSMLSRALVAVLAPHPADQDRVDYLQAWKRRQKPDSDLSRKHTV